MSLAQNTGMDATPDSTSLKASLLALLQQEEERLHVDPFGNPVLAASVAISRMLDSGALDEESLAALVRELRDDAYIRRAARLAAYVGGPGLDRSAAALRTLGERLVRPDPADSPVQLATFRQLTENIRFAAVFTAHPTFSMPPDVGRSLAGMASGLPPPPPFASHRPEKPALEDEFNQACAAIQHGRDATDRLNAALLDAARHAWPRRWSELAPHPVVLASWVGYDTDGRTDIAWSDTLRLRLRMKAMQLQRLADQLRPYPAADAVLRQAESALVAVQAQVDACRPGLPGDLDAVAEFARVLVEGREAALTSTAALVDGLTTAVRASDGDGETQMALCVARSGLVAHGLSLAHTHVRLNATQLHNALRQRLRLEDPGADSALRRVLMTAINTELDQVVPEPVDFGAVLTEESSAVRLMMTVAQILKHIDTATPIRFLVAETESGYTLLCALWLARLYGIEDRLEISPLFETAEALERGARVLDEALRSPHWREHLRRTGKLSLQFGYSDSGRYVGQLAASYLIERLRMQIAEVLDKHGVSGVEVILFDTHGESIGRGAHPGLLLDRLKYLSPTRSRKALTRAGLRVRQESAFQGGDGYLLFGTGALASATVARIAEHVFDLDANPEAQRLPLDPVYDDPDFATDFFSTIKAGMMGLVEDPGYAALLGTFGPALLDPTGSRPGARQMDGMGGPATIRHPRELRAIPNNAILRQLGWCANTLQGLGAALARHPQEFAEMMARSPRFRRAMDFAAHALAHSSLHVLHAIITTLDPQSWLDRAAQAGTAADRERMIAVAAALENLGMWAVSGSMLRRIQADHLALRGVWADAPAMAPGEQLLHAVRLAVVQRLWLLAARVPEFSPRHGVTRQALAVRMLRLDIPASLAVLAEVFPSRPDPAAERDFHEPRATRSAGVYAREHEEIFAPMARLFALVREVSTAVSHEVGAFG